LEHVEQVVLGSREESDVVIEIAVRPRNGKRLKRSALSEALPGDAKDWKKFGYSFSFSKGQYIWNGLTMHITAGEALFLWRWLVEGDFKASEKYYLYNVRSRYGSDFLAEVRK
jgi:hypothetical protein